MVSENIAKQRSTSLTRYTTEANFGQFKGLKEHLRKNIHTSQQSARKVIVLCALHTGIG